MYYKQTDSLAYLIHNHQSWYRDFKMHHAGGVKVLEPETK